MNHFYKNLFFGYIIVIGIIVLLLIREGIAPDFGIKIVTSLFVLSLITRGVIAIDQQKTKQKDKY